MRLALLLHLHVQLAREVALRLDGHPSHSEGGAKAQHAVDDGGSRRRPAPQYK